MKFIFIGLLLFVSSNLFAQNEQVTESNEPKQEKIDSLVTLYKTYLNLQKSMEDSNQEIVRVKRDYSTFKTLLEENNKAVEKLTKKELFSQKSKWNSRRQRILNSVDFVKDANVSLNAIKQLDATSSYLSEVATLNNPNNQDLGFSLSGQLQEILSQKIIKGKKKVNGTKSSKLLAFVKNIVSSPTTESLANSIPIVNTIKSVINLILGTATQGKDIPLEDFVAMQKELKVYIQHYSQLAHAQQKFEQNLDNLEVRKQGLILLLEQFTQERIGSLKGKELELEDYKNFNELLLKEYTTPLVSNTIRSVEALHKKDYYKIVLDKKMSYPSYALNQVKFIRDEIESLGKEYLTIYRSYQNELSSVLLRSKNIGEPQKIEQKINTLQKSLKDIETSFLSSINIEQLNTSYRKLMSN